MNFSVLMSIYNKEEAKYFNRAMQSIWDEQTVKPDEIILVEDGPLTDDLYSSIDEWKKKIGELFKIIRLEANVGLGNALNQGAKHCSYELIARMDTDDISLPIRFEKQLKVFNEKDVDVCSAFISEFEDNEKNIVSYRKIPEQHEDILRYSKLRNPVNHIPSMFKREILEKVGGYKDMLWFEDYYLWARMMQSGARFYNIQESLANIRSGYGQLERRSGLAYAIEEFKFLNTLRKINFLTKIHFIKVFLIRFIARLMPKNLLKLIYKKIRS